MKKITRSAAGMQRLLAVCAIVREGLGLAALTSRYDVEPDNGKDCASCFIPFYGWTVYITFRDVFFSLDVETQVATIVHEHLHASMIPLTQRMYRENAQPDEALHDHIRSSDEITVDHLTEPLVRLLMPRISEILS